MRKIILAACAWLSSLSLIAQNDSSRLDAGSLVLKRNFTQYVSIKGEDLEKMPFSNLSDAINVWLNGAYTVAGNLVFVVDGNIVSDVNAYSIHDIEEVVLLQHAAALTGTAGSQRQMVLITTRRAGAGLHIRGAAQTMLVRRSQATTSLYHQYFAAVEKGGDKFSGGLSLNYLRDVLPMMKAEGAKTTPLNMDRWRLNGNVRWTPDAKNVIELHAGFAPETLDSAWEYHAPANSGSVFEDDALYSHERDQLFSSWVRWHGEWLPGLKNDLQVGYLHFNQNEKNTAVFHFIPSQDSSNTYQDAHEDYHTHQLYVRDRLSYAIHARDWVFEPAVNMSYQEAAQAYDDDNYREVGPDAGTSAGGVTMTPSLASLDEKVRLYVLTASVDISYKQVLDLQAGVVSNLSHRTPVATEAITPRTVAFGSVAVDLLKLDGVQRTNSLKLFASYARRSLYSVNDIFLNDVNGIDDPHRIGLSGQPVMAGTVFPSAAPYLMPTVDKMPKYWICDLGLSWKVLQGRLQLDYNFERRNFSRPVLTEQPSGSLSYWLNTMPSSQHRLGVSYRLVDRAEASWQMGINTTVLRTTNVAELSPYIVGDNAPGNNRPSFTGGWVTRIRYHHFSLGLDILYHASAELFDFGSNGYFLAKRGNGWVLQNVYAGYKLLLHNKGSLELFADCRPMRGGGLISELDLPATSQYYGAGAKLSL
jgi:hypothetical protein